MSISSDSEGHGISSDSEGDSTLYETPTPAIARNKARGKELHVGSVRSASNPAIFTYPDSKIMKRNMKRLTNARHDSRQSQSQKRHGEDGLDTAVKEGKKVIV